MSGEPEPRLPEMANAPIVRELGSREQWVCWKFQKRNGKSTKIPINPNTGQPASVTKPDHWTDFVTAHDGATEHGYDGVGFVFTNEDTYVGVDLDHCRDSTTGDLRDHSPSDLITKIISTEFDPSASCPTWISFHDRIMDGNQRLIRYLQKMVGYALTGSTSEQVFFFFHGNGANGKSTFLQTLCELLGPYAHRAMPELLLAGQFDRHPTEVAALQGARIAVCSEIESERRWASQRLKELTGERQVTARKMHQDPVTIRLHCKIFVHANHKPQVHDNSTAFWRRIRLIPFNVTIPEVDRDKHLPDKLKAELPGILNWALEGCRKWQEEGLGAAPEVIEAVAAYRRQSDTIAQFNAECCVEGPEHRVRPGVLYEAYEMWVTNRGGETASKSAFATRLVELGFERYRPGGKAYWKGIDLVEESSKL